MDEHYSQAQAAYELVLGYGMQVPDMDMAAYRTITADMEALQHAVETVEARQENQTEAFGRELAAGHCTLLCSVECQDCLTVTVVDRLVRSLGDCKKHTLWGMKYPLSFFVSR